MPIETRAISRTDALSNESNHASRRHHAQEEESLFMIAIQVLSAQGRQCLAKFYALAERFEGSR